MKLLSTIIQWIIIATVLFLMFSGCKSAKIHLDVQPITGLQVIVFALCIAFTWVYVLQWFKFIKPFNCMKCMTAWCALFIAYFFHVPNWFIYLFLGLFTGAMFDAIKMRWL